MSVVNVLIRNMCAAILPGSVMREELHSYIPCTRDYIKSYTGSLFLSDERVHSTSRYVHTWNLNWTKYIMREMKERNKVGYIELSWHAGRATNGIVFSCTYADNSIN